MKKVKAWKEINKMGKKPTDKKAPKSPDKKGTKKATARYGK